MKPEFEEIGITPLITLKPQNAILTFQSRTYNPLSPKDRVISNYRFRNEVIVKIPTLDKSNFFNTRFI